jgi:hypothetical protein
VVRWSVNLDLLGANFFHDYTLDADFSL